MRGSTRTALTLVLRARRSSYSCTRDSGRSRCGRTIRNGCATPAAIAASFFRAPATDARRPGAPASAGPSTSWRRRRVRCCRGSSSGSVLAPMARSRGSSATAMAGRSRSSMRRACRTPSRALSRLRRTFSSRRCRCAASPRRATRTAPPTSDRGSRAITTTPIPLLGLERGLARSGVSRLVDRRYASPPAMPHTRGSGRKRRVRNARAVEGIRRRAPQTEVVVLAHCGHSPQRDQPEALTRAVVDFIVRHSPVLTCQGETQ